MRCKGIMRNSADTYNVKRRGLQSALKAAALAVLFLLIFSIVLLSLNSFQSFDFAEADSSRDATADNISEISVGGTTLVDSGSNNNSTWGSKFGISADVSNATNGFGWNSSEYGGWGFTDFDNASGKAIVYWLEFSFSDNALNAVKQGRVSFYAYAHSTFEDGNDDLTNMGVSFGTVHTDPSPDFVSGSSSSRGDTWSNTGKNNLAYYEDVRFWGHAETLTANRHHSRHDFVYGTDGSFDATCALPTDATSIRLVFVVVGDGAIDGGYSNITLKLFEKPNDVISSAGTTFDLTNSLYGDEYKVQAINTGNWSMTIEEHNKADKDVIKQMAFPANTTIAGTDGKNSPSFGSLDYASAGIYNFFDSDKANATTNIITTVTLPKGVTHIDFYADMFVGSRKETGTFGATASHEASVKLELMNNSTLISNASKSVATGSYNDASTHTNSDNANFQKLKIYDSPQSSNTSLKIKFTLIASQSDASMNYDYGNAFGLIGNIKIKMYGAYYVNYDGNGATGGSTANQTFTFSRQDSKETLNANGFTKGSDTFVGWATSASGFVVYKEDYSYNDDGTVTVSPYDTSNGSMLSVGEWYTDWDKEMTRVPGQTITLYAVWVDSDFGILSGKSRDGSWGSANNPFVIDGLARWNNLVDIVNKARDPVDSVSGPYYGKQVSSNAGDNDVSFNGCYFAITAESLELEYMDPVGKSDSAPFRGTVYGGNGVYSAAHTRRRISANIYIESGGYQAGLFGSIDGAHIEDLEVSGEIVNFDTGDTYAGGIVGRSVGTSVIKNCKSTVNVINSAFDADTSAPVNDGKLGAGGIVGRIYSGTTTVENCEYAGGSVYTVSSLAGKVYVKANIFGQKSVGGIVGEVRSGATAAIKGCKTVSGILQGIESVAGIVGISEGNTTIDHVYNGATVNTKKKDSGDTSAGGITGWTSGTLKIYFAVNAGRVVAEGTFAAGIVANTNAALTVEHCYNLGLIQGNKTSGAEWPLGIEDPSAVYASNNSVGDITYNNRVVTNCWSFYVQKAENADFSLIRTSNNDGRVIVAFNSIDTATQSVNDYVRLSDSNNAVSYSWTDITDTTKSFTKFSVLPNAMTLNAGSQIVSYNKISNTDNTQNSRVTPDYSNNVLSADSIENPYVTVQNMVFNSAQTGVTQLAIEIDSISGITNSNSIDYSGKSESNPAASAWIASSSNPFANGFELSYRKSSGNWVNTVTDVYYESSAVPSYVNAYSVRIALKNGGSVTGVYKIGGSVNGSSHTGYKINPKMLLADSAPSFNGAFPTFENSYIYNRGVQGLTAISFNGFVAGESVSSVFTVEGTGFKGTDSYTVGNSQITVATVNKGEYSISVTQKKQNYRIILNGSAVAEGDLSTAIEWSWDIKSKSIDALTSDPDMFFGYGADGVASGCYTFDVNGKMYYALDVMYRDGNNYVYFGDGNAPFALVYNDGSVYKNLDSFNILRAIDGNYIKLVRGTEYSVTVTAEKGASISDDSLNYDSTDINAVTLTFSGMGNYEGSRKVRFTVMNSDFGGNADLSGYGGADNPYLISDVAHLKRLSQIVAGAPAWKSINSTDTSVAVAPNTNATVSLRSYAGGYFYLAADLKIATENGFVPIGTGSDYPFSGHFSGKYKGVGYKVTLSINGGDYAGLFGYLGGATVADVTVGGSISGRNYVGGIAGFADANTVLDMLQNDANVTGANFVGGIAGLLLCSISKAVNGTDATVSGERAVGGIAGGIAYMTASQTISLGENRGYVKYRAFGSGAQAPEGFTLSERGASVSVNGIGGIVGYIYAKYNVSITDCKNYEKSGSYVVDGALANCVGGIVGYAKGDFGYGNLRATVYIRATSDKATESRGQLRGASFVGGLAGYAENVAIEEDCSVIAFSIVGTVEYTGGIAGKWIVNDKSQMPGQRRVQSNVLIDGEKYVGGLVGWLDARNAEGLRLNPFITNGNTNTVKVRGRSYVGALYGGIEGYGYKRNSRNESDSDAIAYINTATAGESIYVDVTLKGGGYVAGGLIGYASGVGILFLGDWVGLSHTPFVMQGSTDFFGGVIGILGENAVISSASDTLGGETIGGVTHSVRYRETQSASDINVGGDFVGSIVGYVASTAGAFLSQGTTLMGNGIKLFNNSRIIGGSFVGGIFGALGKIGENHYVNVNGQHDGVFADAYLMNLLRYGAYGDSATGPDNTLRYATSDDGGLGKLFNYSPIVGNGDFVGGLVGYAGKGCLLALYNPVVTSSVSGFALNSALTYLNVYNGYGNDPTSEESTTIIGANYVGGIAGYISDSSHELTRVISIMMIKGNLHGVEANYDYDGDYVGGIVGYMGGGFLKNSIATSGYNKPSEYVNAFMGDEYVGGLVGMLAGGSIDTSVSRGFRFASVNMTRGGIAGSVNAGTAINASWTFYRVDSPTYSTYSKNKNGNHIIVHKDLVTDYALSYSEYCRMVGLFDNSMKDKIITSASDKAYNEAKEGYLSFIAKLPIENNQIVYYDASGNDRVSSNVFETHSSANKKIFHRFDMANTESFSVCIRPIEFKNIKQNPANEAEGKQFVADAYVRPSASDFYDVDVSSAIYADGKIQLAGGTAFCIGRNHPDPKNNNIVTLGTFNKEFKIGDASTPLIITGDVVNITTGETDWDIFAKAVRNGTDYYGKYVKLALTKDKNITVTLDNLAGLRNSSTGVFKGTFDGDGYTLNVDISSSDPTAISGASVFPGASGATFKNLTIAGNITATGAAYNYVNDTGSQNAANIAGFVGRPTGDLRFENCTNLANITAQRTAGGIVGYTNGKTITLISCVNKGNIDVADKAIGDYQNYNYGTGGIIGYADNAITIESCKNEGNIRGGYNVGGIIGQNDNQTNIYNCANSGEIFGDAFWENEVDYASRVGGGTYRLVYTGGIIGQVGPNGGLNMIASYNSGKIIGYGPIVGGLAGSVGRLVMEERGDIDKSSAKFKSIIAYCYNIGEVHSGGESSSANNRSKSWTSGREELSGSIVGGIVGFLAWGDIKYCYNAGKIITYRIIGYRFSWQARIGGIAGQVQPVSKDNDHICHFQNCFNVGVVEAYGKTNDEVGIYCFSSIGRAVNWGAGILGYIDANSDNSNTKDYVKNSDCYSIANALYVRTECDSWVSSKKEERWSSGVMNDDKDRYIMGTTTISIDGITQNLTLEHFTTYVDSTGKFKVDQPIGGSSDVAANNSASTLIMSNGDPVASFTGSGNAYDETFMDAVKNGTAPYGYIYVYGCLPQLAVFALDTKEGLSMLSVSYGRNEYDEFVGNQAGSAESPYVIKDGVGLLAMSALNGAKSGSAIYNFNDKHIEFANGANNIEGMSSRYINMDMSVSSTSLKSGSAENDYSHFGKNYFLWREGAASGNATITVAERATSNADDRPPMLSNTVVHNNWVAKNYYYSGTYASASQPLSSGANFVDHANFYPIGNVNSEFMGSISGKQGDKYTTEIKNIKISKLERTGTNAVAGLFGAVYDAEISYISVDGEIYAYQNTDNEDFKSIAGGIAGHVSGDSVISNCSAGSANGQLKVAAYSAQKNITQPKVKGYAGGVVGVAGPSLLGGSAQNLKTLTIEECRSANAEINSLKANAGGIIGFAGDPTDAAGNGNYVNLINVYVYNTKVCTLSNVVNDDDLDRAGVDIGGIAGTCDGNTIFVINGAYVGIAHPTDVDTVSTLKVDVIGENSVGGVIGSARGNTELRNIEVGAEVSILREARGAAQNVPGTLTLYHTSIGGVIGRTLEDSSNILRDRIVFDGSITVDVANGDGKPVANIGGIIGAMENGTRFLGGSTVVVNGSISSALTENIRNIGGVVGASLDGAFDGSFTVSPQISAGGAVYIGGFIGRNIGTSNILSSATGTVIVIEANIIGKSQVGGLVGLNGYVYADSVVAGALLIGADTYQGGRYEGTVDITISEKAVIRSDGDDAGGLIGQNVASGNGLGLVITKGTIYNKGTVLGINNVGGIVGNNEGDITMGGSSLSNVELRIVNEGSVRGGTYSNGVYASDGNNVGGIIGYLKKGSIAGTFANIGNVDGGRFVGGSIGRLDKDVVLTVSGNGNTNFYNGSNGARGTVGNVTGKMYVGGSIGAMFGAISGSGNARVIFINNGVVNGDTFTGGNIGLLSGSVINAQFTNNGRVVASGATAIGGSVGFIGTSASYDPQEYEHRTVSVTNSHFEFIADSAEGDAITVNGSAPAGKGEFDWGGVGGAIGVIGGTANGFDNAGGALWKNVTLYAEGSISAKNINNVGGAIGLIKADNIAINNMLAFYTSVEGKKNVGGIVGAAVGANASINNSFNIEGTVKGDVAGGIIGYSLKDGEGRTVADTSYWVKGYRNAELMALNLESVVSDLGKYVAVSDPKDGTVFTKELTDLYGTPAKYTGKDADGEDWQAYLTKLSGSPVKEVNGVWASEQSTTGYTTGEAHTGWYFVFANDRKGLDTTHISAKNSDTPSVLGEEERAAELVYWKRIAGAYTAEERVPDGSGYSDATRPLTSAIAGNVSGGSVSDNGTVSEGYIYAAALESKVEGYYLYMDATGDNKPLIYYSTSSVNWNGTGNQEKPFYLIAQTSLVGGKNAQNVAVYYRSVGIGRSLTYNGYNRFAPITSDIGGGKVIEYVAGSVPSSGTAGKYVYTLTDENGASINNICEAGDYVIAVAIYYYDQNGNCGKIGGISGGTLHIDKMMLESSLTASNGIYDGNNTGGEILLTLNGITPNDRNTARPVRFTISGQSAGQISGVLDIGLLMEKLGGLGTAKFEPKDREASRELVNITGNNGDRIYLAEYTVAISDSVKNITWDTSCIADSYPENVLPYKVTVKFRFLQTVSDTFTLQIEENGTSANYATNPSPLTAKFNITPRELELKLSSGESAASECGYDGMEHSITYAFTGWADSAKEDKTALIASLLPYLQYTSLDEDTLNKIVGSSDKLWDITTSGGNTTPLEEDGKLYFEATWQINNSSIHLAKMKEKGKYFVKFAKEAAYELNGETYMLTEGGNYYVKVPKDSATGNPSQLYRITPNSFTVSWISAQPETYNAMYHYLAANFKAKYAFGNAAIIAQEIATLIPDGSADGQYVIESVDAENVRVKFRVGPNAGTYTVGLPAVSTENCAIDNADAKGTFTINKLDISVTFSGDKIVVYNGASHEAQSIEVRCDTDPNAAPTYKFSGSMGEYVLTMFGGVDGKANAEEDNQVRIALRYDNGKGTVSQYAVNAGTYTASLDPADIRPVGANNFNVHGDASGRLTINKASIYFSWATENTFVYDAKPHGRDIKASIQDDWVTGDKLTGLTMDYDPASTNATTARFNIRNAYNNQIETILLPVDGNGMINAHGTAYPVKVNMGGITISGNNRAGNALLDNYSITFNSASSGSYTINKREISIASISGLSFDKTYDATTNIRTTGWTVNFGTSPKPTNFTINAEYDSADVSNSRIVRFTVTLGLGNNGFTNFTFANGKNSATYSHTGKILPKQLTVTLDMLRGARAVRTYNGYDWYGGAAGASNSINSDIAHSAIRRLGEGFTVSGIVAGELSSGAVIITARYKEATEERSEFDAYVNNVTGMGADLFVADTEYGDDDYFYKNLVFTLGGTSAGNYKFVVKIGNNTVGTGAGTAGDAGAITVSGKSSGIQVEITPLTARATYGSTAQSYATADNTYNTNWKPVSGSVYTGVGGDILSLAMINNWRYVNNNPANGIREYHSYTVIRGGENSNVLSAKLSSATGVHVNYRLGNQPILTIGYFVDKDEFEISSISGLMIASYYYSASKSGDNEFGVISQVKWNFVVSEDDFFANAGLDAVTNGKTFTDADGNPIEITCWDDYFDWLERTEGVEIVFNNSEEQAGWGYYSADKNASAKSFDRFRQTANISGVLTAQDIAILNGMFKKTVVNEDGTVNEDESHDWGVGSKYLPNFLKLSAGSVATAKGSLFIGDFDGAYDGGGYVIDSLNIVGIADQADNYFGMFARILGKANVKNVHLRNISVTASGSGNIYVGALAGESCQTSVENVSAHVTMNVNASGTAYVGGVFGLSSSALDGAIALGNIKVRAGEAHVGGVIGKSTSASVDNVISLAEIWSISASAYVGGILGADSASALGGAHAFMANSVWSNKVAAAGGISYTELYNKSISGYGANKYYYTGETGGTKGDYDVLDDVKLTKMDGEANSKTNPRESMRLADIIDVYVLMYAKTAATTSVEGVSVDVFGISDTSWLVGRAHGTDNAGDAIVIANQQGIALMRELRFATFTLIGDVYMYSTYRLQTASGAFYGKVKANGFAIYISTWDGAQKAFEIEVGSETPTAVIKKA